MDNQKYIIGNWKMNPANLSEAVSLATSISKKITNRSSNTFLGIAPPAIFISEILKLKSFQNSEISIGSQNVFWEKSGAFTGETSPAQLRSIGVDFVILGHSERRIYMNETDDDIRKKLISAQESGLKVVLCIGENVEVKKQGKEASMNLIEKQIKSVLFGLEDMKNIIIAYEPIWAISTFKESIPAEPNSIEEMSKFIKNLCYKLYKHTPSVIYGGSININNAKTFLIKDNIDGLLIGGASLSDDEFVRIVESSNEIN